MRAVEEIKADIENCTSDKQEDYDKLWIEWFRAVANGIEPDRIEEICQAERDGRCVVLLVIPQNKTLYWIWGNEIMPVLYRGILGGCVDRDKKYHVTHNMATKKDRTFINGKKPFTYKAGDKRMFYSEDIGKTVFLTKEEAEKALKGGLE